MAQTEKKRPGVMLYFDIIPAIKLLSDEEKGILFDAILSYGETGIEPELDGKLAMAWVFIQQSSDRDAVRYAEKVLKTKYASYCRITKCKDPDASLLSFRDWKEFIYQESESEE